ncbi:MAG: PA1571 family protein [Pseudomonadota bacterium]
MNSLTRETANRRDEAGRTASVGWGAAIVDENGNETPITESMIERACDELARSWMFPRRDTAALAR